MDRYELITRNTQEIVTIEDLNELLASEKTPTAYAGYEPSGKIHLGHVLTVNKLIDLQNAGFEITVLLADLHAYLNEKGTLEEVRELAEYNKRCFIALGLDKAKFVFGSDFQLNHDYTMNVLRVAQHTTLNRARRSMSEIARNTEHPMVSQMIYPIMQAVDIMSLGIDAAVGGIDQRKIHMLAREELSTIGYRAPVCIHTPILLGLDGEKMSSSKDNYISVDDDEKTVEKKIGKAFCPKGVADENPVIELFRYHIFPRFSVVEVKRAQKFGGDLCYDTYMELAEDFAKEKRHPMDLKKAASEYINLLLDPVREML
ncbi:tyrosine--tRNA ligase [Methanosarcinales archaeon]|nr:MAG: tyrosine--tRNA ligase [Methanosarcinales archaeon]